MKGELIKIGEDDYILHVNNKPFAYKKLSLKNCQAIANGYDLDELAKVNYDCDPYIAEYLEHEFKKGFQKAIEILGDKKFSEIDLYRAFLINSAGNNETLKQFFDETVLPTFQQTEWDVEIEMDFAIYPANLPKEGEERPAMIPKLDADGCLILKRK